jgi:hypothetical protein
MFDPLKTLLPFLLVGCFTTDSDGDGLTNQQEQDGGTNPDVADSDGDGLDDLIEVEFVGTDPTLADTDGDGAQDGAEVELGLDPLDERSHPYTLGWPMLSELEKDVLAQGVAPPIAAVGQRVRRATVYDRLAEAVDLYDFAGKPTVVSVQPWHGPEDGDAEYFPFWLDREPELVAPFMPSYWLRDEAFAGSYYLMVVVRGRPDFSSEPPTIEGMEAYCAFDHPEIGCFADASWELYDHVGNPEGSAWLLLDENMIVRSFVLNPESDWETAFTDLEEKLAIMLDIVPP